MHLSLQVRAAIGTLGASDKRSNEARNTGRPGPEASMPFISKTPKPPYYAVVFTSIKADVDHTEHTEMFKRVMALAQGYPGYLGIEPARNPDGTGVAAVYWKDHESILAFARDPDHRVAKKKGREIWYSHYMIRICKVEREYGRPDQ